MQDVRRSNDSVVFSLLLLAYKSTNPHFVCDEYPPSKQTLHALMRWFAYSGFRNARCNASICVLQSFSVANGDFIKYFTWLKKIAHSIKNHIHTCVCVWEGSGMKCSLRRLNFIATTKRFYSLLLNITQNFLSLSCAKICSYFADFHRFQQTTLG